VLKVLEEMNVPIDCIAGTSMVRWWVRLRVGHPAAELEKFVVGIDWKAIVGGVGRRDLQTIEQKRAGVTFSNEIELGLRTSGSSCGRHRQHEQHRGPAAQLRGAFRTQTDFDRLPIRTAPWRPTC